MTDNAEKLASLFRRQEELGHLRERAEYYLAQARGERETLAALERDNPSIATVKREEYERNISSFEKLGNDFSGRARALDAELMAEWKANPEMLAVVGFPAPPSFNTEQVPPATLAEAKAFADQMERDREAAAARRARDHDRSR